jgi:2-polyprenyl-3-methyl-5-hydroxy-6-metoxy-1,4-benzoquinol methylase
MINILKKNKILWTILSFILRINYTFFWKIRNYHPKKSKEIRIKKYYEDKLIKIHFNKIFHASIIELGCGYGIRLFNLIKHKKKFILSGFDVNYNNIIFAKELNKNKNLGIKFYNQNIKKIKLTAKVDYIISSFSLIYLKKKDLIIFFKNNKNMIKKGFLLIEYHSSDKSNNLSYYVHNFKKIFDDAEMNNFNISFKKIAYNNWIKKDHCAYKITGEIK